MVTDYPDGGITFINTNKNNTKTDTFVIRGNDNVGVNITNPSKKLHVNGDTQIDGNTQINGTVTANEFS